jgi:thiol-disulfide isomerase/thioredoxin
MKWFAVLAVTGSWALAQQPPAQSGASSPAAREELERTLAATVNSPLEYLRTIENYLGQHPDAADRPNLERRAANAAMALNDDGLVVRYGELVLSRQPDDVQILTHVSHSLLATDSRETAERALKYARRAEELIRQMQKGAAPANMNTAEWRNWTDQAMARALTDEARATGNLGRKEDALATAQRAFEAYPNADSAREIALWYESLGKPLEAARALADAFTIAQAADAALVRDRSRMGELYRQAKGSDDGLGSLFLESYDRNLALLHNRDLRLNPGDPNAGRTNPMEFTLSGVDGQKLDMASLKGKVLVLDMWATWCVPCREQHPLYEQVQERFRDNSAVVFLSIDADMERQPVKPFLEAMKWQGPVYFEDGLVRVFSVDDLPVTILMDRHGALFSRMNGFVKELFADQLTERIRQALAR